jgi:photosystem II stability/assembly factor-like uncharacterized protein
MPVHEMGYLIVKPNREIIDDPFLRHTATTLDLNLRKQGLPIRKLRLDALEYARHMPISDDGSSTPPTEDYIYSQPALPGKSNWLQVGPTCIPYAQAESSYYYYPGLSKNPPILNNGRVTCIVVHPEHGNVIYIGTASGGIWKTEDCGRNWIAISDYAPSLSIGALAMDPNDHDIMYAGTGEGNIESIGEARSANPETYYGCGLLKTVDGGRKWKLLGGEGNPFNGASFYRIVINNFNSSILFVATSYGLFRSTTGGQDWVKMKNGLPLGQNYSRVTDVAIHPKNPNIVYAAVGGDGIYKSSNATEAQDPLWKKLTGGFPESKPKFEGISLARISLGVSYSKPDTIYALASSHYSLLDNENDDTSGAVEHPPESKRYWLYGIIDQCYCSTDGGDSWKPISLPGVGTITSPWVKNSIGGQGPYNLNICVDPKNSDIIYLSGVSLWKGIRDKNTDKWNIIDIGLPIHSDNHAFAFDPNDPLIIYAGSDGGIYKSINGGETWSDAINEGLCITQFEFIDQHPTSEAVIFGGTQDNGTLQYRNSPAFYFSYDGDGGFVSVDSYNSNTVINQYIYNFLHLSKAAGKYDSWIDIPVLDEKNKAPPCLFYAPFTLDQKNPKNIVFGSDRIFLDTNQGLNGWKTMSGNENSIPLPFLYKDPSAKKPAELVSALNFVSSNLIYAATTFGKVYRIINTSDGWKGNRIDTDLPSMYIWDVANMPNDPDSIIVIMGGYGLQEEVASHIWRGNMTKEGNTFEWKDISGNGKGKLPHIPINAVVIDDTQPNQIYIGTDIGVFRTSTQGKTWTRFSENLPNCAIYDMKLHPETRLLRIATHGRGIWERQLDTKSFNDVNLFVRNHLMDTGYFSSLSDLTLAAFADPLQNENGGIKLNDVLTWDMCPDIKVDSPRGDPPFYQIDAPDTVDYVKFESRLQHRNPRRMYMCNVYVQIHNRGIKPIVQDATINLFYANMSKDGKYPDLPKDFWTSSFSPKDYSLWRPIRTARNLPEGQKTLTNTEPTIVVWQWNVPPDIGDRACILVVIDSGEDPILEDNKKITDIKELVETDRHIGLKTINISN